MRPFDHLLAPTTRLMGAMSFARKLLLVGAVFTAPILILLWLFVSAELERAHLGELEHVGLTAVLPARAVMQPLQAHRATSQAVLEGDATAADRQREAAARIDAAFAGNAALAPSLGSAPAATWAQLRNDWQTLKAATGNASAADSFAAHTRLLHQLQDFVAQIADGARLSLDAEMDTRALIEAVAAHLPALSEAAADTRGLGTRVMAQRGANSAERMALYEATRRLDAEYQALDATLQRAAIANGALTPALSETRARLRDAFASLGENVRRDIALASPPQGEAAALIARANQALETGWAAFDTLAATLDGLLAARIRAEYRKAAMSVGAVSLGYALVMLLYIGFRRSLTQTVSALEAGVTRMAQGEFGRPLALETRDELHAVADGINAAMDAVNRLLAAQRQLAAQHAAGDIDQRLDEGQFRGAFAEVAHQINTLLASHIGVTQELSQVVRRYGTGDFSSDMRELPGRQRDVTQAAQEVKRSLQSLAEEMQTLVSAAARGDFSVRGNESRYSHGYRDMVMTLNQLMEVCSTGLDDVARVLNAISNNDLSQRIHAQYSGTFGTLKDDANGTVDRLREIVGQIKDAASVINTAAGEISSGNLDLSGRTEHQAGRLEETASSMEQINATVRRNAENAAQARSLAYGSNEIAQRGGEVVNQVVATMSEIQSSSQKIADIIGVIDGIAFQTNILALNAAVEAARAGEQGRGFAVVASEVRSLAQRSALAAKEIKQLIDDSVSRIDTGATLVGEAGRTMREVVESFEQVTHLVTQIADASREQSAGIAQVAAAIDEMDESTQQNAALVEQAAASAGSLADQARGLVDTVSRFKLVGAPAPAMRAAGLDFDRVINAHLQWKTKLNAYLGGQGEALDAAVVGRDDKCELGCWIHGDGHAFAGLPLFGALKSRHADFHRCAAEVITRRSNGDVEGARHLLTHDFDTLSTQTVGQIRELKRAVTHGSATSDAAGPRLLRVANAAG